jgi:DNA-binding Lrp family transcriptional regulator
VEKRVCLLRIVEKVSAMAGDSELGNEIRKIEKNSLQKFKNQNRALKKFGKPGLKVYRAIRKSGIGIEELMEKTKVEQEQLFEILIFLKETGMIETVGEVGGEEPVVDEETEMVEPEGIMGEEEVEEETPATLAPEEEIEPEEEEAEIEPVEEEEEEGPLAPSAEIEPEEEEAEKEEPAEEEEIAPEEPEEEGIVPLDLESEAEEEEKEPVLEEEPEPEEEEVEDEIAPSESKEGEEEDEEDEDIFLTPGERKIKAEYGQVGIDVYNLIDGQRTAEEIMKSTGVTETKLIEMLDFMEKKGIIKLEHPGAKKKAVTAKMPAVREVGFAPMLEEGSTPVKPLGGELGKAFTLEVPTRTKGNMLREIQMKANLMIKYKQAGVQMFELIDGNRDVVELALKIGIPLFRVYKILAYLEKEGMLTLAPTTREDIKRKYGDDGYSVYKRYGREGVMLYQLIGKDMDLREMANQTSDDKQRIVEIFMFIHKLLGIDLPIDEDVLLERLESTEPNAK